MERRELLFFLLAFLSLWKPLVLALSQISLPEEDERVQTYIVHVRKPRSLVLRSVREREDWHKSFLPSLALDSGEPRLMYSYQHAIGGFAARLTSREAEAMETADGVLSVQPDGELETRTTYSHQFLGLSRSGQLWEKSNKGEGMVIGLLEQGFDPSHSSFSDNDMTPPPPTWKGNCSADPGRCNKKLVGYKIYDGPGSRRKRLTHGTHVASIAAGNPVVPASFRGEACGTASGAAPRAHLAFYTVYDNAGILKAVDQAIYDGVNVLSLSIGNRGGPEFRYDPISIATLSATKHGIFVSYAVGNKGPAERTLEENAPWTLSVGASSTDRVTRVEIKLRNGDVVYGETPNAKSDFFPVGASLSAVVLADPDDLDVQQCEAFSDVFEKVNVEEKAVLCKQGYLRTPNPAPRKCKVDDLGGKALIFLNTDDYGSTVIYAFNCRVPTVTVKYEDVDRLKNYVRSDPNPTLTLEPMGTLDGVRGHPAVADFSARGPSVVNNMVLKPDVLGPGVNILAANALTKDGFFYASGTSQAAPHLSGIAAMLRSLHPTWSPAMVKSAIMTTADWQDNTGMPIADHSGKPASLHAMGAGQVNPTRAADPGLVYDIQYRDYVKYVCGLGYAQQEVEEVVQQEVDCDDIGGISGEELNYPSFYVKATFDPKVITRTLTNVGHPRETYTLSMDEPRDVLIDVFPRTLNFHHLRQNLTYTVTISSANPNLGGTAEGQLTWESAGHRVRSPIAVTFA